MLSEYCLLKLQLADPRSIFLKFILLLAEKIITYLKSQTPSFLLTVQLSLDYDDIKGRLLLITAIVRRFQTENI